jgi:hypothetical protein
MKRWVKWSISPEARSSPAGFLTTVNRVDYDEAGYRFNAHAFIPGEYVTIRDPDDAHTFRVVSAEATT